jgi:hypothetical protein
MLDLRSRDSADKLLQRMAADGKIERRGRGMYVLPGTPTLLNHQSVSSSARDSSSRACHRDIEQAAFP